jgi:hypothetical protein
VGGLEGSHHPGQHRDKNSDDAKKALQVIREVVADHSQVVAQRK